MDIERSRRTQPVITGCTSLGRGSILVCQDKYSFTKTDPDDLNYFSVSAKEL